MKNWKRWVGAALLLLLLLLAWLMWPDRRVAQAKALQKELFGPSGRSLTSEQRREKWTQYRKLRENMSPAQREALSAESRKRRQEQMARYFSMSPGEKTRYLDEQINRMEKMRQSWQAKNAKNAQNGGGKGKSGAAGSGRGGRSAGSSSQGQTSNRARTPASRDQRRQQRLDSTTPAERAMFSQYFKDLNARRMQLGLPPMGRGPGPQRRSS